ncbi:MAG: DUF1569 domain-containing protein [Bacteroidota bacterium]
MKILTITFFLTIGIIWAMAEKSNQKEKIFLESELAELETYFEYRDSLNTKVSKVDITWHLDHSIRTINEICKATKNSDPKNFKGSIHLGRSFLLLINKIPRGRAQAPQIVTPPETIHTDSLHIQLKKARLNLIVYDSLLKKAFFKHPYLGNLKKKTAKRFIKIHTEHHLKIIRDILKDRY